MFLLIIIFLNILFLFNSSLDWDTSNHLYYGKLKSENIQFKASYRLGIKYFFLPFIYHKTWPLLKNNLKLYRILNLFFFLSNLFNFNKKFKFEK